MENENIENDVTAVPALADEGKTTDEVQENDAAKVVAEGNNNEQHGTGEEFSYLQRNEFTSEIYKIEVRNLGYFGIGEFKKLIKSKLNLDMTKIKSPLRKDFAFVCFRSEEEKQRAIELLNGYKWKGRELQALVAKASADPLVKRRHEAVAGEQQNNKMQRTSAEATCPLASLPYEEQLQQKLEKMTGLLKKFQNSLKHTNRDAYKHLQHFKFEGVLPAPSINGYRNKNEFTIGKNSEGEVVVGFRLSSYADGSVEVAEVQNLPHIPDAAKWAAKTFQEFVRKSNFLPFNPEQNAGHFRQLMVRNSAHTGELMLVAGVFSSNLTADELVQLKHDLKEFYGNYESSDYKCTSLYYQDVKHREAGQLVFPVEHLSGTTHITDVIHELRFRISPLAFFQVNTECANVLYQKAIDLVQPKAHTNVLDICCGTGTIALAFAKHCRQVLGVEIIPDAIKDAEYNAQENGITNCKFYAGNADVYIESLVKEAEYGRAPDAPYELVAVVDPPRAGLHNKSIASIRAATSIKRLVYISCNPERAQRNWIELGRPESRQYKGEPFYPKVAVAVDMFPHTAHTELAILFERADANANAEKRTEVPANEAAQLDANASKDTDNTEQP